MLCTFCPPTILGNFYGNPEKLPKLSVDQMCRACDTQDQTLKTIRALHFPEFGGFLGSQHPSPNVKTLCNFEPQIFSVAPPAEPRGEKKLFFVQALGGEKLLKFGEKWAVKTF